MEILRLAYKNIIHRKARFVLTTISVVMGVMFVVGVFILTDGIRSTFGELSDDIAGTSDLIVRSEQDFGNRDQAAPIPTSLLPVLEDTPGVAEVSPGVAEFGFVLLDANDEVISSGFGGQAPVIGINWDDSPFSNLYPNFDFGDGSSRRPVNDSEFAVDSDSAIDNDLLLGETYTIVIPSGQFSGRKDFTLVGVFNFAASEENRTLGALLIALDNESASTIFNDGQGYDQYEVFLEPGADPATTIENIKTALANSPTVVQSLTEAGVGVEVVSTGVLADEAADMFNSFVDIFRNVLLGFAFVILLVSTFVIYNTFSIVLDQRIKELGLLRAVGITGRQLQRLVLGEALVVGVAATIIGLAAGFGLSFILKAVLGALGGLTGVPVILSLRTIIAAVIVGVGITILSALPPAIRSRRVPPIAAIREGISAARQTAVRRRPILGWSVLSIGVLVAVLSLSSSWIAIVLLSLIATFAIYWGGIRIGDWVGHAGVFLFGIVWLVLAAFPDFLDVKSGEAFALYGTGAVIVFTGVNMISPIFGSSVARGIGAPIRKLYGMVGHLGVENSARNPKRTAATSAALMVGLALVATTAVLATSLKATFSEILQDSVRSDWIICKQNCQSEDGIFTAAIADDLDALDETNSTLGFSFVESAIRVNESSSAQGTVTLRDDVFDILGTEISKLDQHIDVDIKVLSENDDIFNGVLVYEDRAEAYDLGVGSKIGIEFSSGGSSTLEVVGIFTDNRVLSADWVINQPLLDENLTTQRDLFVSVIENPNYTEVEIREALNSTAAFVDPDVEAQTKAEFNDSQTGQIDDVLIVVSFFLGLSFIVAILGIANTLALSIFERTREIGLLRAIGMRRLQIRRMVRLEGLVIALFGCVLGIGLGVAFGIIGVYVIPNSFISTLSIEPLNLVIYGLIGGVAGLLSALFPAIRAGRLNILDAISHE